MTSRRTLIAFSLLAASVFWMQRAHEPNVFAQDKAKAEESKKDDAEKKDRKRLPNNYGKLGLSDAQKTKVYDAQAKYDDEIDKLEQQIVALKAKQDAECEAVLTAEQKSRLDELNQEAKAKKAAKKKKAAKDE